MSTKLEDMNNQLAHMRANLNKTNDKIKNLKEINRDRLQDILILRRRILEVERGG